MSDFGSIDYAVGWRGRLGPLEQARLVEHATEVAKEVRDQLDRLPDPSSSRATRAPSGSVPRRDENPCNAWAWRCRVGSAGEGPLSGKEIAVKGTVSVGGLPLTNGSRVLAGHLAQHDATIVQRILAAGGTITGVATTEDMSFSGVSITSADGAVRNPWDERRSAGGSSSGAAALVALGEADLAIGADQGGSIRLPASLCGVFGLKPTYGLVPYTGCLGIDPCIDHVGPLARTAPDAALLLDVIAGDDDGRDPRQRHAPGSFDSAASLEAGVAGLRVGVLDEGFEPAVDERVAYVVRDVAGRFRDLGATVRNVSVPEHAWGLPVHTAIILQGAAQHMLRGLGTGAIGKGEYDGSFARAAAEGLRTRGQLLGAGVKIAGLAGAQLWDSHRAHYYAKAQNLARTLASRYDRVLREFDVLVMPTTLVPAPRLPSPDLAPLDAFVDGSDPRLVSNTCGFNQTGHPALNVPVGPLSELPVGLQIVGRHLDDHIVLRAARALEAAGLTRTVIDRR